MARDRNDRTLEEEELRRIGSPVEGMLNVVLSTHGDLAGELVCPVHPRKGADKTN